VVVEGGVFSAAATWHESEQEEGVLAEVATWHKWVADGRDNHMVSPCNCMAPLELDTEVATHGNQHHKILDHHFSAHTKQEVPYYFPFHSMAEKAKRSPHDHAP
jgi:hypothetical protein